MRWVRAQYRGQEAELLVAADAEIPRPHRAQRVVVPVNGINRAVVQAVNVGRTLSDDIRAVYVTVDPDAGDALRERWTRQLPDVPFVVVESPYRALIGPVVAYLDVLDRTWSPDMEVPTTVVILPEYVGRHWWDRFLYNQGARRLRAQLVGREHTVVLDVPYRRSDRRAGPPIRRRGTRPRDAGPVEPDGDRGARRMTLLPGRRPGDRRVQVARVRPESFEVAPRPAEAGARSRPPRRRRRLRRAHRGRDDPPGAPDQRARAGTWTSPVTALFTATSAVCVTGLVVVDTATYWSPFGQTGHLLPRPARRLRDRHDLHPPPRAGDRAADRACATACWWPSRQGVADLGAVDAVPAADGRLHVGVPRRSVRRCFFVDRLAAGAGPALRRVTWSVFHAATAFNTAGFDLTGGFRSLTPYAEQPVVLVTTMVLVVIGRPRLRHRRRCGRQAALASLRPRDEDRGPPQHGAVRRRRGVLHRRRVGKPGDARCPSGRRPDRQRSVSLGDGPLLGLQHGGYGRPRDPLALRAARPHVRRRRVGRNCRRDPGQHPRRPSRGRPFRRAGLAVGPGIRPPDPARGGVPGARGRPARSHGRLRRCPGARGHEPSSASSGSSSRSSPRSAPAASRWGSRPSSTMPEGSSSSSRCTWAGSARSRSSSRSRRGPGRSRSGPRSSRRASADRRDPMHEQVIVVGLGRFGSAAARELAALDNEVLAIDVDEAAVNEIAPDVTHASRSMRLPRAPAVCWRSRLLGRDRRDGGRHGRQHLRHDGPPGPRRANDRQGSRAAPRPDPPNGSAPIGSSTQRWRRASGRAYVQHRPASWTTSSSGRASGSPGSCRRRRTSAGRSATSTCRRRLPPDTDRPAARREGRRQPDPGRVAAGRRRAGPRGPRRGIRSLRGVRRRRAGGWRGPPARSSTPSSRAAGRVRRCYRVRLGRLRDADSV